MGKRILPKRFVVGSTRIPDNTTRKGPSEGGTVSFVTRGRANALSMTSRAWPCRPPAEHHARKETVMGMGNVTPCMEIGKAAISPPPLRGKRIFMAGYSARRSRSDVAAAGEQPFCRVPAGFFKSITCHEGKESFNAKQPGKCFGTASRFCHADCPGKWASASGQTSRSGDFPSRPKFHGPAE